MNLTFPHAPVVLTACLVLGSWTTANATTVTTFDATFQGNGQWYNSDMRGAGTATIETLTGAPAVGAPLPTGAAKLTTTIGASKAEVGVSDNYGTVSNILSSLDLHYSYYKENAGAVAPSPSLKLTFVNPSVTTTGDNKGYIQLVWEAYVQPYPVFTNPTTGVWTDVDIDYTHGVFWATGGFGTANSGGGPAYRTLAEWDAVLNADFDAAQLVTVAIGVGTNNDNQIGYFDDVQISHSFGSGYSASYNFEAAASAVPEPGSLALMGLSLAALAVNRRRRRA